MSEKDANHDPQQALANTADTTPQPYLSEAPPPYQQQPGYQVSPGFEMPPGYQALPGYQAPPGALAPTGYPGQVYQGAPAGYVVASQPGPYVLQTSMQQIPPDYQALSWFACLCCCWPLGIVAILKSNEVRSSLTRGDFNSARIASNSARNFAYTAIGIGIGFIVIYIIAMIMVFTIFSVS